MKKYLAFFLIALMAVSALSAAGVVTTRKAAAQPPPPYVILYKPGAVYTYAPNQYNDKDAFFTSGGTNVQHAERASGGWAYAWMSTATPAAGQGNEDMVWTGVRLQLDLGGQDWSTIKGNKCTLTMTVIGHIQNNGNAITKAQLDWGANFVVTGQHPMESSVTVTGNGAKTVITKATWHGTVEDAFMETTALQLFSGEIFLEQGPASTGQASGFVIVPSITVSFN